MSDRNLTVQLLDEVDSTNALALAAIEEGAAEGTAFVADAQSSGRGRRESGGHRRQWFSPPGKNLYLSVVVRPVLALEKSSALTLAVGAALAEEFRSAAGVDVMIKWPNDLYVGGRKLGGVLTEAVTGVRGLEGAAIGVGLNINCSSEEFPAELQTIATSLREETGRRWDRLTLALSVCRAILGASSSYEKQGLDVFSQRLERLDYLRDREIRLELDGEARRGIARGIGKRGGLRVQFEDGSQREVVAGEVTLRHRGI